MVLKEPVGRHWIIICFLTIVLASVGPASDIPCRGLMYENRNQIDYGPLRVKGISGVVLYESSPIPKACVGVFTELSHELIAFMQTDDDGRFELKGIPDGEYRLIVKCEGLCLANAKIRISRHADYMKCLVARMSTLGLDTCSFVELTPEFPTPR